VICGGTFIGQVAADARTKSGPAGDPGGKILAELATLKTAIPPHAAHLGKVGIEPHLTNSCQTSRPDVQEAIGFDSRQSVTQVQQTVARNMRRAGWRHFTRAGPAKWYNQIAGKQVLAETYLATWSRQLPRKVTANATIQVAVPVSGWKSGDVLHWSLGALAPGVGEPHMHCGEG
jgi:hypothetical protein